MSCPRGRLSRSQRCAKTRCISRRRLKPFGSAASSRATPQSLTHSLNYSTQGEAKLEARQPAKKAGFSVSFDSPVPGSALQMLSSPMLLYLLAEETGYSQASYYTTLGLFLMSFPGLYSLVMRAPKAKVRGH